MLKVDTPNAFGAENMGVGRPEWTLDWYAPYQPGEQTDPIGAIAGYTKVVRGGGLDWRHSATKTTPDLNVPATAPYFARAANRASMAPAYATKDGNIGFRVIQASMPDSKPGPAAVLFRDRSQANPNRTERPHHRGPIPRNPGTTPTNSSPTSTATACPASAGRLASRQVLG